MTQAQKLIWGCLGLLGLSTCAVLAVAVLMWGVSEGLLPSVRVDRGGLVLVDPPALVLPARASRPVTTTAPALAPTATLTPTRTVKPTRTPTLTPTATATRELSPTFTRVVPLTTPTETSAAPTATATRVIRTAAPTSTLAVTLIAKVVPKKVPATAVVVGNPYATAEALSVEAINRQRQKAKLQGMVQDGALNEIARARSKDMAVRGYFSHEDPAGGALPLEKLLLDNHISYKMAGENIAYFLGPVRVDVLPDLSTQKWMESPPHRENIMEPVYNLTGFGIASAQTDEGTMWYLTQVFVQR